MSVYCRDPDLSLIEIASYVEGQPAALRAAEEHLDPRFCLMTSVAFASGDDAESYKSEEQQHDPCRRFGDRRWCEAA